MHVLYRRYLWADPVYSVNSNSLFSRLSVTEQNSQISRYHGTEQLLVQTCADIYLPWKKKSEYFLGICTYKGRPI